MTFFRITLHRSPIGLPQKSRLVLYALGLQKRKSVVFHPVTPDVAGQIMKVKELVAVQEVAEKKEKWQVKEERRPESGYWLERGSEVIR